MDFLYWLVDNLYLAIMILFLGGIMLILEFKRSQWLKENISPFRRHYTYKISALMIVLAMSLLLFTKTADQKREIDGYCIISSLFTTSSEHKQLFEAIHNHDLDMVKELFNVPGAEESRDSYYKTPLHAALRERDEKIILFLIKNSRNVNQLDGLYFTRYTPLHYAVFHSEKIISELLKHGANIDARGYNGETPLGIACRFDKTDAALLLINNNANLYLDYCSWEPIYVSVENNNFAIVQSMIEHGFDVNKSRYGGYRIIHHAAKYNKTRIIRLLAENGADLNCKYKKYSRKWFYTNKTPYDIAIKHGNIEAAELLMKLGAQ